MSRVLVPATLLVACAADPPRSAKSPSQGELDLTSQEAKLPDVELAPDPFTQFAWRFEAGPGVEGFMYSLHGEAAAAGLGVGLAARSEGDALVVSVVVEQEEAESRIFRLIVRHRGEVVATGRVNARGKAFEGLARAAGRKIVHRLIASQRLLNYLQSQVRHASATAPSREPVATARPEPRRREADDPRSAPPQANYPRSGYKWVRIPARDLFVTVRVDGRAFYSQAPLEDVENFTQTDKAGWTCARLPPTESDESSTFALRCVDSAGTEVRAAATCSHVGRSKADSGEVVVPMRNSHRITLRVACANSEKARQ